MRGRAKGKWSIREDIEGAGGPEGSMADGCTGGRGETDGRKGRRGKRKERREGLEIEIIYRKRGF